MRRLGNRMWGKKGWFVILRYSEESGFCVGLCRSFGVPQDDKLPPSASHAIALGVSPGLRIRRGGMEVGLSGGGRYLGFSPSRKECVDVCRENSATC